MKNTQLLCTFATVDTVDSTIQWIKQTYKVTFDTVYVLENVETPTLLYLTYNAEISSPQDLLKIPSSTISLHRKKQSNTLYTINALNALIRELNNGVLDARFSINWSDYNNMILVTAYNRLKKIQTKLVRTVNLKEL